MRSVLMDIRNNKTRTYLHCPSILKGLPYDQFQNTTFPTSILPIKNDTISLFQVKADRFIHDFTIVHNGHICQTHQIFRKKFQWLLSPLKTIITVIVCFLRSAWTKGQVSHGFLFQERDNLSRADSIHHLASVHPLRLPPPIK